MLTSMGPVRFRLFAKEAPATCMHFVKLIREGGEVKGKHRQPFYRGLTFHRVISGFMIQGGCPQGNGLGGPGYAIPAELAAKDAEGKVPEKLRHVTGRLSMARSSHYDSAGSQFFVCVADSPNLDGEYTVFGEVARGLDVILSIAEVPTGAKDKPLEDVTIEYMEVLPDVAG
ncbi:MAG: peptidylprolyl isomerase [Planctomycetota bacterium]|nr:MAG: peptidylprolyl isomerase [Planctomycetota bacterium]